jgi:hypothetical protein
MKSNPLFRKLKENTVKVLRILFEDKEMQGDRFDDLKCSTSGAIWVEIENIHSSASYKKARLQSNRVLGLKPNIDTHQGKTPDIQIDSHGRIILPSKIRKTITHDTIIQLKELSDGRVIILLSSKLENCR